jgi:hypothetical protein
MSLGQENQNYAQNINYFTLNFTYVKNILLMKVRQSLTRKFKRLS